MDLVATQLVMDIFLLPQVFYLQSYGNQKGFQLPFNNWAFLDGDQNPFWSPYVKQLKFFGHHM